MRSGAVQDETWDIIGLLLLRGPKGKVAEAGLTAKATAEAAEAIPKASNAALQRTIDYLFKPTDRIPGGTAGAVRHELETGELVGGRSHVISAQERIQNLRNVMRRESLSPQDRATAQRLLHDLQNALQTKRKLELSDITYANLSEKLIETVPDLLPQYRKELEWWGGEVPGPHNIYADVLNPYLIALLKSEPNGEIEGVLTRIFAFLETLANHEDVHISEVVGVSVLEPVYGAGLLERARQYMGPATLQMSREIEEWKPTKESSVTSL